MALSRRLTAGSPPLQRLTTVSMATTKLAAKHRESRSTASMTVASDKPRASRVEVAGAPPVNPLKLSPPEKTKPEQRVLDLFTKGTGRADISKMTGASHNFPRHVLRRTPSNRYSDSEYNREEHASEKKGIAA